jgi:uncharacterized membrane protein YcaP (DUF421 family)
MTKDEFKIEVELLEVKQREIEFEVLLLQRQVARLQYCMFIGFIILGLILVIGFADKDMLIPVTAVGLAVWLLVYLGQMWLFCRRIKQKRGSHAA